MMKKNKILAVSFIAMLAVSSAYATVVTQTNVVGTNGVSVSVPASGATNAGKLVISGPDLSGKQDALTFTTSGSGNVVTSVSKSGNTVTATKGSTAVLTSRTVNGKPLSADITLDGTDVKVKSGYAKKTGNVAAGDTIDTAIGKLETKADNNTSSISELQTNVGILDDNIGILDDLNTTHDTDIVGAINEVHDALADKEDVGNKVTATSGTDYTNNKTNTTKYPSMATANQLATDAANGRQAKLGGSGNNGKAVIAGSTAGTVSYRAIDTASGGTANSDSLITSGAVNSGLATKQNIQIGAAKSGSTASTDSGKAVVVDENGKIAMGNKLGTAAYQNTTDTYSSTGTAPVSGKAVASAISGVTSTANSALQTVTANSDAGVVTNVAKSGTAVTMTKAKVTNAMVADDAAIADSKIARTGTITSGNTNIPTGGTVYTAVNAKQDKTTAVTHTASTAAGSATKPVYVNASGVATPITSYEGNAATATKATQDASGNVITTTYATKSELTTGLAAKEDNANKLTSDVSRNSTNMQSDTLYPTVATTQAMITDVTGGLTTAVGNKQNKSTADYQMGNSSGSWTTMTTQQQNMLNGKIPVGSETATTNTTYASIWVE